MPTCTKSTERRNWKNNLISKWREKDIPERRRGSGEFHRHQRTFLIHLRRAHNFTFHLVVSSGIFHGDLGAFADSFLQDHHCAARADRMRVAGQHLPSHVNDHRHAHQHALRAATLLRGGLPRHCRPRGVMGRSRFQIRYWWLHSSSPQKSMAGATSSTPYSQPPSGRSSLFQTITAALLAFIATLVSATRCSRGRSCSRTTMQP